MIHRVRGKELSLLELIAIALGGMVGGGIFTILGISVSMIGVYTPIAIIIGGVFALFSAYSYVKLGLYYKDEGAAYSFLKKTFSSSPFVASLIGWWVVFGYISTLSLYAYTFSSYAISGFEFGNNEIIRKAIAMLVILLFSLINIWSVKGMGKAEDIMVYTKLVILVVISFTLINHSSISLPTLLEDSKNTTLFAILIVSSITFVAYEGFELVINAVNEMEKPQINIPRAIYSAILLAVLIYVVISVGAIFAIPFKDIIANQEYALAAGADNILGHIGSEVVILGAVLATSSAISGTLFGASRQIAVISSDGYFPSFLSKRKNSIPVYAIITMASLAFLLILVGNLEVILEFGSITFLLVSILMAYANFKIKDKTQANAIIILVALVSLFFGTLLIFYYEYTTDIHQIYFILSIYVILSISAFLFSKFEKGK
ncbi:APC family permease [Sulfurimonas sp. C5]|uniref:APC family permease n=1 Tax=Sulfurimonas sp. C5 TaxID=3036947 RepID=UPI00245671AB|nr:APC family permease [Sulfurimonas sp. C5]MDH4943991.1 APC family permease [Sulfurimonas sp. C5]